MKIFCLDALSHRYLSTCLPSDSKQKGLKGVGSANGSGLVNKRQWEQSGLGEGSDRWSRSRKCELDNNRTAEEEKWMK